MAQPSLRPQDVVVLAKLLTYKTGRPPIARMSSELALSGSEVHAALRRLATSRLLSDDASGNRPLLENAEEFLVHGVKYMFPARRGEVTRGVPTSHSAVPLIGHFGPSSDLPVVWPLLEGSQRGVTLEPLYKTLPGVALRDQALYELMVLIDALREGRPRERQIAKEELLTRIRYRVEPGAETP